MRILVAIVFALTCPLWSYGAAPSVVGSPSNAAYNGSGGSTTTSLTVPTNLSGDLLIVSTFGIEAGTTSLPGGWTAFENEFYDFPADSNYTVRLWWKISNGSEGASITVTHNAFSLLRANMIVVRGAADPAVRAIVSDVAFDETADVNNPSPSLTVAYDESLVIRLVGERQGTCSFTPPAGYTEIYDDGAGAFGSVTIATATANTGATGVKTFTNSLGWPNSFVLPAFALAPPSAASPKSVAKILLQLSDARLRRQSKHFATYGVYALTP